MMADGGAWAEFRGDLRTSLKAWRVAPLLPVISVALYVAGLARGPWAVLALPVALFSAGWYGTERIWYLRIFRGQTISGKELLRFTRAFFWRFVWLGLMVGLILSIPAVILVIFVLTGDPDEALELISNPWFWILSALPAFAIDLILTFVTQALAFTTPRVGQAFGIGMRMLREHWPRSAGYALVPPLAVVFLLRAPGASSISLTNQMLLTAGAALLNLWFKGATAAFYLRRMEVGNHGAAFITFDEAGALARDDDAQA